MIRMLASMRSSLAASEPRQLGANRGKEVTFLRESFFQVVRAHSKLLDATLYLASGQFAAGPTSIFGGSMDHKLVGALRSISAGHAERPFGILHSPRSNARAGAESGPSREAGRVTFHCEPSAPSSISRACCFPHASKESFQRGIVSGFKFNSVNEHIAVLVNQVF